MNSIAARLPRIGWKRALAGLVAVVLLAPTPVLALVWQSPWVIFQAQSGTPTPPPAIVSSFDFFNGSVLTVDMGKYTGNGASSVQAQRQFSVADGTDFLTVAHDFQTAIKNTSLKVSVEITPLGFKGTHWKPINFSRSAGNHERIVGQDKARLRLIRQGSTGSYIVTVKVSYDTRDCRGGSWDNSAPPPGTPHRFTFFGV